MDVKPYFIHERAICDSPNIGHGTRIWGFTHVLAGAHIGKNCNIGEQVFIENNVLIGDGCTIKNGVSLWDGLTLERDVFVGPNAVFTNDLKPRAFIKRGPELLLPTLIGMGATIGANSTIVCGVTIGAYSMVGAGSVVTRDVLPHSLVLGNPARFVAKVCYCGERLTLNDFCSFCGDCLKENSSLLVAQRVSIL